MSVVCSYPQFLKQHFLNHLIEYAFTSTELFRLSSTKVLMVPVWWQKLKIYLKTLNIFLRIYNAESLNIWHLASPYDLLQSIYESWPCSQWQPNHTGYLVDIGLYRKILLSLLLWNCNAQCIDICHVLLLSGPLQKLYKSCPYGQNWPQPRGHFIYMLLYSKIIFNNCNA